MKSGLSLAGIVLWLVTAALTLPVAAQSLGRFNIGSVPDQTIWEGSTREVLLHWDEKAGVVMRYTASPIPVGALALSRAAGNDWRFTYSPAPADIKPFTVTVTATLGQTETRQSWQITPQPVLEPEEAFFSSGPHTQAPAAKYGISVFEQEDAVPTGLNYVAPINLRTVRIVGETVELEQGHENGLAEYFNRNDVRSVEIIAEYVIIRDPMKAKQCDVTIWARELTFEGDGKIITTPRELTESPGESGKGADGLPAGDVTLNIGAIQTDGPGLRFDLRGGKGQVGGPGAHGGPGADVNTYWDSVRYCDSGACKTHNPSSGHKIIYWKFTLFGITAKDGGKASGWPGNGKPAKPSGKPGEGGDAGSLTSSVPLIGVYDLAGGITPGPTLPTSWPYDRYAGGRAGIPAKSEKVHFWYSPFSMKSSGETHTASAGKDAAIPSGNTTAGKAGTYQPQLNRYAWVHPLSVSKILQHVRDNYLGDRTVEAQTRLEEYVSVLNNFRATTAWNQIDATRQLDLSLIHDEMRLLLQQIEAGLDYYGNPPAWVPMLSFEVNQTLFQNELDRAMNTLYLAYWIGNKAATEQQRLDAMTELRATLRDQLETAQADYNIAIARLPVLRQQAEQLDAEIKTVQNDLEIEELRLLNDTREEDWVLGLRIGLKLSAMMCQMVPVYQPTLGLVGEGLRVASDFNPDRPWDSISGLKSLAAAYQEADFEEAANDQEAASSEIDADKAEENSIDYAQALQTAGTGLAKGIEDISGFIKEREAPSEEMLAELERLKSLSPEYKALLEKVEELTARNGEFAIELVETMQKIGALSGIMSRSVLAIDALSRDIAPAATVLDDRATAYLEEMEQRAFDRLVKYHYYLAKAYEYRLLLPYTEPLDLESLITKFGEIADLNNDHQITPAQFATLKSVYQDKLSQVAETIFDHYNANRPDLSVPVRFNLLPDEIETLNAGGKVMLNLRDAGFFQPSEENVRIVDLKLFSIDAAPRGGGNVGRSAFVDLKIEHSGISRLKRNGETYLFRHYSRNTDNPFVWGGRYDVIDDQIDPFEISDANDSLLRSLLSGDAVSDMLLYSRPSAWADLEISRTSVNSGGPPLDISSVRLEMVYDFSPRAQSSKQRDLEVFVQTIAENGAGQPVIEDSTFEPYFDLGSKDSNGREDARGHFLRVFDSAAGPVTITAPASYGQWNFAGWTDQFGQELPGGPYTNPTFVASLPEDTILVAQYGLDASPAVEVVPLRLDPPIVRGNQVILNWNGAPGIRLQSLEALSTGLWQDVPGTNGMSSATLQKTSRAMFYRLVR